MNLLHEISSYLNRLKDLEKNMQARSAGFALCRHGMKRFSCTNSEVIVDATVKNEKRRLGHQK